ncbi:MAG: DUF1028 domain-containing protein [Alphaproteobacteria bacterium]
MTFSILAFDEKTGGFAAASATGNLCVGGWVLRGNIDSGLVASQGTAPSTFWRDESLRAMRMGADAASALAQVVDEDTGKGFRQLLTLDRTGQTAGHTGEQSLPYAGHVCAPNLVVGGNMLASREVVDAMSATFMSTEDTLGERLLAALMAAKGAGGDYRGLMSASLLCLTPERPPLDLRIDSSEDPLGDLRKLYDKCNSSPYKDWLDEVPVAEDRHRAPDTKLLQDSKTG